MRCHEVRNHTSEYIDHFLDEADRGRILDHVAACDECREHVEATRRVIASLRAMPAPAPPADFLDRAIVAIDREAEPAMTIVTRRHFRLKPRYEGTLLEVGRQLLRNYEFKLIAYSVGLFISFAMFSGLLASMRPLLSISRFESPSAQSVWYSEREALVLVDSSIPAAYSLPRISTAGGLPVYATSSEISGAEDLVVIAEIATDGRGSIVEVLSGRPDARAVGELATALNRPRTFVPAYATSGRPVSSRVVLRFERVDIIG
jgi:hypothetical protein